MRDIDLNATPTDQVPVNTYLIYGHSRSGKTTFAGTFPRPLFLSDASEGGWASLQHMSDDQLFEPGVKPMVWAIDKMNDMTVARERAKPLIESGKVQTIVIDSVSFYTDLYLNFLINLQAKLDTRRAYGDLGNHLRDLRVQMHTLGVNVVWLALAKDPSEDEPLGGPLIPGQQAAKFMAGVHFVFHTRQHQEKQGTKLLPVVHEVRTRKYGAYVAGNRLGQLADQLPDPFVGTYADLITHLGYDADAVRAALPKLAAPQPVKPVAKPVVYTAKTSTLQPANPPVSQRPTVVVSK